MFCSDFIFDGASLSSKNLMICCINGNTPSKSGGDITFTTVRTPYSNRSQFYTSKYEEVLSFTFQIGKNECDSDIDYFTQSEQSALKLWLKRSDGYHWLKFVQEGFDVWFHAQFNLQPEYLFGHVIGYNCTVVTDSPYGYSGTYTRSTTLSPGEYYDIQNQSDNLGVIYPRVRITANGSGTVKLETDCSGSIETTVINAVHSGDIITLDGEYDYTEGVRYLDFFNFVFPKISRTYSQDYTRIANTGTVPVSLLITYREIKEVDV